MKRLIPFLILLAIFLQGCGEFVRYIRDHPQEQTAVANGDFRIRLSKLESSPGFMPSSRYLIESSTNGELWTQAYRWSQDDPWSLSEIDINTVTPTVGYFYNATKFGITVDSGKTWKIIDVYETMKKDGSDKIARRFERVPRVIVNENGTGSIYAQSYHNKDGEKQEIYTTTDFGQNWQLITSAR